MDAVGKYIENISIGLARQHLKGTSESDVAHHVECQTARPDGHVSSRAPIHYSHGLGTICLIYHAVTEDIDVLQDMIFHCLYHTSRERL